LTRRILEKDNSILDWESPHGTVQGLILQGGDQQDGKSLEKVQKGGQVTG